ncbi:MAG: deoxyribodipyrimidine photo-lyase, partial [Sphingobacterium sp.]
MSKKVVLVWFRNDLRLHDNEVLVEAINKSDLIIPVFCFDPRYFGKNEQTLYHTGVKRAHFLRSAVREL